MSDTSPTRPWVKQMLFLGAALGVIFFQLLPLETTPRRWTGPDLLVLLTLAWALRRPDYLPAYLVALVMLLADLLFQRPPGLMAGLMVLAAEALKRRSASMRDQTFALEWLAISTTLLAVMLSYRLVLSILLVPQAPIGLTLIQLVVSILCYPAVAALTHYAFGVRKVSPGEVDAWGHKL